MALVFQFLCHLSCFCCGTIANSQVAWPVFAAPWEPASRVLCTSADSKQGKAVCWGKRGWRARAGHPCARGAQGYECHPLLSHLQVIAALDGQSVIRQESHQVHCVGLSTSPPALLLFISSLYFQHLFLIHILTVTHGRSPQMHKVAAG